MPGSLCLRRCVRDLYPLRSLRRIPRPISSEVQSPTFGQLRRNSTKASQQGSAQKSVPGPKEEPSKSGSKVPKLLLGTLLVGAAGMAAYQAGYIDLQFMDEKLPSTIREQNLTKMYENLKSPFEQKVDQKQTMLDPKNGIVQDTPKGLPAEGIPTAGEQPTPAEEKETETVTQGTLPVQDEHGADTKLPSQDTLSVDIKPNVVNKAAGEVPLGQADKISSTVSPVESSPTTAEVQKDPLGADVGEQKSLAETYLLQEEHDIPKDVSAKETKSDGIVGGVKASDDGKIMLDIIDAIHAAEKKQADTDAYTYSEEKRKLKERYEKELKDTRARELMYAEEAAILDKELKKEKMKAAAAVKELQEKTEQKLMDELQRKDEEASQQVEKVQELAKAELAAALAKEKASQIEQIAEADLNIDALCMAFYARSEEARQSHSVHKLALGTLALEEALSSGSPIRTEVDQLRKSLEGIDKDSLLELALSSLPEDVLKYGSDTRMELKQKFNSLKATIRHFGLIPSGGGGILTHAVAHVASNIKVEEDPSGDGVESLISRVEDLIVGGDLTAATEALTGGLQGTAAEEAAAEWVKQARKCAIAEQTLTLLHSYASSITFT
uniref:Formation of crista junctions protein 1 n=2 Tax=Aegilops tauschii TaxID=37682 RepID=A0A453DA70_AEGTS